MIHTSLPQNCVVFLLLCELRWSAIINGRPCQTTRLKENRAISRHVCVDHCILLLQHLSTHMHFITNGYKRFSKTNSTDPRQRVPSMTKSEIVVMVIQRHGKEAGPMFQKGEPSKGRGNGYVSCLRTQVSRLGIRTHTLLVSDTPIIRLVPLFYSRIIFQMLVRIPVLSFVSMLDTLL